MLYVKVKQQASIQLQQYVNMQGYVGCLEDYCSVLLPYSISSGALGSPGFVLSYLYDRHNIPYNNRSLTTKSTQVHI